MKRTKVRKKTAKTAGPKPAAKAAAKKAIGKKSVAKKTKTSGVKKASGAVPAKSADAIDAMVKASTQALKLTIDPVWQKSISFNLQLILRFAALLDEFPLSDEAEPAPVFHA